MTYIQELDPFNPAYDREPMKDRPDDKIFTTEIPQDALNVEFEQADHSFEDKSPTLKQIGGCHYAVLAIQPMTYALENNLNYAQANVVKYVTRYKLKNGIEDLRKAIHCLELLIEHEENK